VQKSLILAALLSLLAGAARAACPANPADCGPVAASQVTTPILNATGTVKMSAVPSGTPTVCLARNASGDVVTTACGSGGGGGSLTVTDTATSVTATTLTFPLSTFVVTDGGSGNAIVGMKVTDNTHAGSFSSWNVGGQDTMTANGTATLPTLTAGQSFMLVTASGVTATLTKPGGVTLGGSIASQTTLGPVSFLSCVYNSGALYNCVSGSATSTGGGAVTVANSTAVLGTSSIASGACAAAVVSAGSGIATTDTITWGFNGDPTAVTGYAPTVNGMLTIIVYPSANNANFKVCNNTSASITPSAAITLNWRVVR
jgi:hypothetical protein